MQNNPDSLSRFFNIGVFGGLALGLVCGVHAMNGATQTNAPSFDGSRSYPALGGNQSGAAAVATGDFNGDGKPDMVAATPENNGVSVFLNNGDGIFGGAVRYSTAAAPKKPT